MCGSLPAPTPFPDLNVVLEDFVASARGALADNFGAAYLQGSFALGDADVHSDVDFIVATNAEPTGEQVGALQHMHKRIYGLDSPWAQHLEGSYIPKDTLRRVDPSRSPYWYLDNGATELIRDDHCNTAVVRWTLREHGVVLAGPDPTSLVDPVDAAQLRAEALEAIAEDATWAHEPQDRFKDAHGRGPDMSRWKQPYLVVTFCRLLHTLETGAVGSKRESAEWALSRLEPRWALLIQRAIDDRPDPWARVHQPADPALVDETLEFADYASERVKR
jgi:predicted nucleotidyltransferase